MTKERENIHQNPLNKKKMVEMQFDYIISLLRVVKKKWIKKNWSKVRGFFTTHYS